MLEESGLKYSFNGEQRYCVSNTMNLCIYGVSSEALMISSKQYCGISNGSACNSNSYKPSYVLKAMGVSDEQISNCIRISWGWNIEIEDVEDAFGKLLEAAKRLA